ncbi:MAG: cell envelope integrity protein CreD [Bacteroidetes bacterium]|nr:cell envelope integrity protein CreD [Bacteroidota bacterium]
MENIFSSFWNRNRIIFKSFLIGILILLLLIPTVFIQNLVSERQERQSQAVSEVSAKWASQQTLGGPTIVVPYQEAVTTEDGKHSIEKKFAYFLPDQLSIHSVIIPEKRYRGIYQVVVYATELQISGSLDSLRFADMNINEDKILWNEAAVFFDISDVRGLKDEVNITVNQIPINLVPGKFANPQFKNALSGLLPAPLANAHGSLAFSMSLKLKGSENLLFLPMGKQTDISIKSSWNSPSFIGNYLPDTRQINDSGFAANWKVLYLNRNFPQQWKDRIYDLSPFAFGVNLIVPVDAYQQTTRSVKYAILCIVLTFTAFFLIELLYSRSIHPLQYILVGVALCIFYTLLLSFSEYIGFNFSYLIAAAATILLISWYVKSILQSSKMALFIAALLLAMYGFIFTLIQLEDYALLIGSIGLFITLAMVMYFSRKVKWTS